MTLGRAADQQRMFDELDDDASGVLDNDEFGV
jgi:hypothetical protein